MVRIYKADSRGSSTNKLAGKKAREWCGPPKDEPWAWLSRELVESGAWRGRSIHCARLLDFLLLDHMANAGRENGRLMATYDQLVAFGITRKRISSAIKEAERRGLARVQHGGRWNMTNRPSLFRLTFYADHTGAPASNDWKRYHDPRKQNHDTKKGTTVVPTGVTTKANSTTKAQSETAEIGQFPNTPVVPTGGTASISSLVGAAAQQGRQT